MREKPQNDKDAYLGAEQHPQVYNKEGRVVVVDVAEEYPDTGEGGVLFLFEGDFPFLEECWSQLVNILSRKLLFEGAYLLLNRRCRFIG